MQRFDGYDHVIGRGGEIWRALGVGFAEFQGFEGVKGEVGVAGGKKPWRDPSDQAVHYAGLLLGGLLAAGFIFIAIRSIRTNVIYKAGGRYRRGEYIQIGEADALLYGLMFLGMAGIIIVVLVKLWRNL
jgi:hypothetical protein